MIRIIQGDCIEGLRTLPDASVHCVVTSPPYWGLRDYGQDGQIGLEETPEVYVDRMVEVFREVRRVLRDDGTCWVNLGDSYANNGARDSSKVGGFTGDRIRRGVKGTMDSRPREIPSGLKPKDLVGIPWRVAFALQADGWWLRQDIIWHKPNPMPESVTDRCTKAHEYVFLLTKSARYFYDAEAVAESAKVGARTFNGSPTYADGDRNDADRKNETPITTRNKRSVWTVTTKPFSGAHFAVMPPDLVEPCLLAGTSEKGCCVECGAPWDRVVEVDRVLISKSKRSSGNIDINDAEDGRHQSTVHTIGWQATCTCEADTTPCTVLDPFGGAGTTALVADRLGRNAILCELNPEYVKIAVDRLKDDNPIFTQVEVTSAS
jgi:DNA modification methylase